MLSFNGTFLYSTILAYSMYVRSEDDAIEKVAEITGGRKELRYIL